MIIKTVYAIACVDESDRFVLETLVDDRAFDSKEEAYNYLHTECADWIETDGYSFDDYEIIKIETVITRNV